MIRHFVLRAPQWCDSLKLIKPKENNMHALRRGFINTLVGTAFALAFASISVNASAEDLPKVAMKTSMGELVIELYPEKAPKTVDNFLQYVKSGFYDDTIFHRIINGFMIQGGGYDKNFDEKETRDPIKNEARNGLKNQPYMLAMARTQNPNSATAQFFINVNNNRFLDFPGQDGFGYAVFGKVIKGMEVVDQIRLVPTGQQDVPVKPVIIESARIID